MRLRTSIILAATAVAALTVSGTASASPATGHGPGSSIHATGVRPGAIKHISSSTGTLTLKSTNAYADQTSDNWSGYVTPEVSAGYTATSTTFTVPTLTTCGSTDTASSFWAGLDGDGDNTVEQDGVEVDCTGGSASLYAWVETYPAPQQEIDNSTTGTPAPVEPGDSIVSTVTEIDPSEYNVFVEDATQRWSLSADLDMPAGYTGEDLTSEVITEATTECDPTCTIMPLTDFGQVNFGDALYFTSSGATDYANSNTTKIDLYQNGVEADDVGPLAADSAFTVTYGTPDQVTVTNPGNQSTQVDAPPVSLQIRATSNTGAALSYAASGLPPGLSINSTTGLISGTPTAIGTYGVTVTATDTKGTPGSAAFTWTILKKPAAPKPGAPKPHQCGARTATTLRICWPAVAHATSYSGLLYKHGHNFTTSALREVFRGLRRNTSYRLRMWASNAAGSSAVVVLVVRTK